MLPPTLTSSPTKYVCMHAVANHMQISKLCQKRLPALVNEPDPIYVYTLKKQLLTNASIVVCPVWKTDHSTSQAYDRPS